MHLKQLAYEYLEKRGVPHPTITDGTKLREECEELLKAFKEWRDSPTAENRYFARAELGDCGIVLAFLAEELNTSVEHCMITKAEKDRGRGPGSKPWTEPIEGHA